MNQILFSELKVFARKKLCEFLEVTPEQIKNTFLEDPQNAIDLEINGRTFDVKVARPTLVMKNNASLFWDFDVRDNQWVNGRNVKLMTKSLRCDYYVLIGLEGSTPKKIFLIAAKDIPSSHVRISVSGSSKYNKYEI